MDNKTKEAIKQLQSEIRQLQMTIAGKRLENKPEASDAEAGAAGRKEKDAKEPVVQCVVHPVHSLGGDEPKRLTLTATAAQVSQVTNDAAAAVGYALASPQKVALLRALLHKEAESASALGEGTGLTTGSLYHHLRELMRADLVHQSGRNSYVLTERGVRTLYVLLALAVE